MLFKGRGSLLLEADTIVSIKRRGSPEVGGKKNVLRKRVIRGRPYPPRKSYHLIYIQRLTKQKEIVMNTFEGGKRDIIISIRQAPERTCAEGILPVFLAAEQVWGPPRHEKKEKKVPSTGKKKRFWRGTKVDDCQRLKRIFFAGTAQYMKRKKARREKNPTWCTWGNVSLWEGGKKVPRQRKRKEDSSRLPIHAEKEGNP